MATDPFLFPNRRRLGARAVPVHRAHVERRGWRACVRRDSRGFNSRRRRGDYSIHVVRGVGGDPEIGEGGVGKETRRYRYHISPHNHHSRHYLPFLSVRPLFSLKSSTSIRTGTCLAFRFSARLVRTTRLKSRRTICTPEVRLRIFAGR